MAADRAAPGQGRETCSVHRNGTRGSGAGPPARRRVLAPRVPRYVRGGAPQPGPADPLRDPERTRRRRRRAGVRAVGRPGSGAPPPRRAVLLGRDPPSGRRLRRHRLQSLGRARVHERPELPRPRRRARPKRAPSTGRAARRRRRALRVQPRAHGGLRRRLRHRRRRGGSRRDDRGDRSVEARRSHDPRGRPARARHDPGRVRARHVRRRVRRALHPGGAPALRRGSRPGRQAHCGRPRRVAVPEAAARAAGGGRPRSPQRRDLPGLHAGMPVLPGRHDHAPGPGASRGAGAHDGAGRPATHGLRRGRVDVAVQRGLLGGRRARRRPRQRAGRLGLREPVAAVAARRRVHRRHRQRDPEGPPHRAHVRARRRDVADSAGPQQAHYRGRPVRRRRRARTRRVGGA